MTLGAGTYRALVSPSAKGETNPFQAGVMLNESFITGA